MKTTLTPSTGPTSSEAASLQPTKLASLLAMASGVVALPQNAAADIIYTDLNSNPTVVGFGGTDSFFFTIPGAAQAGFQRYERIEYTSYFGVYEITYRTVIAGDLGGGWAEIRGIVPGYAAPLPAGASWDQGAAVNFYNVAVGVASNYGRVPVNGYDRQYLAWMFLDTTAGNATRYGWVEISLSINNVTFPAGSSGPNVTIWGYAYDTTGAKPTMGVVPEPSSGALLALGALALGSRGLRRWREKRQAANPV